MYIFIFIYACMYVRMCICTHTPIPHHGLLWFCHSVGLVLRTRGQEMKQGHRETLSSDCLHKIHILAEHSLPHAQWSVILQPNCISTLRLYDK